MNFWTQPTQTLRSLIQRKAPQLRQIRHLYSPILEREVDLDVFLPPDYKSNTKHSYPLLLINDGQDLAAAQYAKTLESLWKKKKIPSIISVGIYANHDRIREYGTARQPDYKGRGDRAGLYERFILEELIPYMMGKFRISGVTEETAYAGFSLGGLSAMDIAWRNPSIFGTVGVFSGALWWRWSEVSEQNPDADRIMHDIIEKAWNKNDNQRYWFQTGTQDEQEDRNNNGVIDSIDDTLDLIRELKRKDTPDEYIRYLEVEGGEHNTATWGVAMYDFLVWTFGSGWRYGD
jgi:enterochelin esterase-like enzyme